MPNGLDFEERMSEVLAWSRGYEERIFPVLWIHPHEENIKEKVKRAAEAGVVGFQMTCSNYYVHEEACLSLLQTVADLGKPVFFHSGILWDGQVSSDYNRPIHFEALLRVRGLRFSMGHCAWPWVDECIALYGKFLHTKRYDKGCAEMFFDITPGTPEIYRRELLSKLYTVGYDVGHNVMFGTDGSAHAYRVAWTRRWLGLDGGILNELGVSRQNRERLYGDNLLRFLGKREASEQVLPDMDDGYAWSCEEPSAKEIAKKWYERLGFPERYRPEFYGALSAIKLSDAIVVEEYDKHSQDGLRNLCSCLYFCEETARRYRERGIPEEILDATLYDLVRWTALWSREKGALYLGELGWLTRHLSMRLFHIGRLQYEMGILKCDLPEHGLSKGAPVIKMHIPADGPLDVEECRRSVAEAKAFFARYFPDFSYACMVCDSWLLDKALKQYLPETSNILRFADLFTRAYETPSDSLLMFLFSMNTTRANIGQAVPMSGFAKRIKEAVLQGEIFHLTLGILKDM